MLIKTARITNLRNVLVQIPGFVVASWGVDQEDELEVHFDESTQQLIIRPGGAMNERAKQQDI